MEVEIRTGAAGAAVAVLTGKLTAGPAVARLGEEIGNLLQRNLTDILLDMDKVEVIDCAGLAQIINCFCQVRARGGRLKLQRIRRSLGELLQLFRLDSVLEVYESDQVPGSVAAGRSGAPTRPRLFPASAGVPCLGWEEP